MTAKEIIKNIQDKLQKIKIIIEKNMPNSYQDFGILFDMIGNARMTRFRNVYDNRKIIYKYFISYSPEVLKEIENYNENKLLKFFENIISFFYRCGYCH